MFVIFQRYLELRTFKKTIFKDNCFYEYFLNQCKANVPHHTAATTLINNANQLTGI